ncbi:MAG: hypothetical protein LJI21_01660 [Wolbachia endosymbiont of Menacanthus eurysternus]|nr:MAG: hypothetical protein LJI21_01660 [Wolbachia endosymbiont of Menacanthus eurysternus]
MNSGTTNKENFFNFKINHDVAVTGYPTKIWNAIKKYSVNNTLPIVAINTWLQFSLTCIATIIATSNNVNFITNISHSKKMQVYAFTSVILGTILLTSLVIKQAYRQKIKYETLKNGRNLIDIKIRGGKSDKINEIAENASTIEIVPDIHFMEERKRKKFSIIFPISGKQGEILENKRQENRNKIILFAIPYITNGLTIIIALTKFGLVNSQSLKQWSFVVEVALIIIIEICLTLNKLKGNEIDNVFNTVKKFNNIDILFPLREGGGIISVMENKFENNEENNPLSKLIKLFDNQLTELIGKINILFNNFLIDAKSSIDEKFLEPICEKIQKTFSNFKEIKGDVRKDLDLLHTEILEILGNTKELTKKVNSLDIKNTFSKLEGTIETIQSKIEQFEPNWIIGKFKSTTPYNGNRYSNVLNKFEICTEDTEERKKKWQKQLKIVNDQLILKDKQTQLNYIDLGIKKLDYTDNLLKLEDRVKELNNTVKKLELETKQNELKQKREKLEKKKSELEKLNERKEKINGKPSEFLYYILESVKLKEKNDKEKSNKVKMTLRNFNNEIIIHWKDGSQTICNTKKQGNFSATWVDFIDQNIQSAFETTAAYVK